MCGPSPDGPRWPVQWSAPGGAAVLQPAAPANLDGAESVALRLAVPPNTTGARFDIAVTDSGGRRAALGEVSLDGLPGSGQTTDVWAREVRVPLAAATAAGLDLTAIARLELVPRTDSGRAWLIDAWGWRPGAPPVTAGAPTRVDLGEVQASEGDSGARTFRLPVTVSGDRPARVQVFVVNGVTGEQTHRQVTVAAGATEIDLPVTVEADTRPGPDLVYRVLAKAARAPWSVTTWAH